jgi:hypothetical protein
LIQRGEPRLQHFARSKTRKFRSRLAFTTTAGDPLAARPGAVHMSVCGNRQVIDLQARSAFASVCSLKIEKNFESGTGRMFGFSQALDLAAGTGVCSKSARSENSQRCARVAFERFVFKAMFNARACAPRIGLNRFDSIGCGTTSPLRRSVQ